MNTSPSAAKCRFFTFCAVFHMFLRQNERSKIHVNWTLDFANPTVSQLFKNITRFFHIFRRFPCVFMSKWEVKMHVKMHVKMYVYIYIYIYNVYAFSVAVCVFSILDPRSRIPDPWSWMLDPGSKIQDQGSESQDPGCSNVLSETIKKREVLWTMDGCMVPSRVVIRKRDWSSVSAMDHRLLSVTDIYLYRAMYVPCSTRGVAPRLLSCCPRRWYEKKCRAT